MSKGWKPGEADAIYAAAMNVKAQREAAVEDRRKHGHYDIRTKNIEISEDDALKQIQDGLRLCKNADHVKIWHGNEAPRNEEGISDILAVVEVPVQALVDAGLETVGVAAAIEVKGTKTPTSGKQIQFLERWRKKGAIVGVARSYDDCERLVREKIPGAKLEGPK